MNSAARSRLHTPTCTTEGGADAKQQHEDGKKPSKQEATVGWQHLSGFGTGVARAKQPNLGTERKLAYVAVSGE